MNINEAKLVSFVTALVNDGVLSINDIENLMYHVKACYPVQSEPELVKVNLKPLFDYMLSGRKIEAIKEHRMLTGQGLKESKDEVERVMNKFNGG